MPIGASGTHDVGWTWQAWPDGPDERQVWSGGAAFVAMVRPPTCGIATTLAQLARLHVARNRCVFVEREWVRDRS